MSGAFGYWVSSKGTYQSGLSTFWGSWAFLIGSLVQWYESLVKHPVEVEKKEEMVPWNMRVQAHSLSEERIPSVVHYSRSV